MKVELNKKAAAIVEDLLLLDPGVLLVLCAYLIAAAEPEKFRWKELLGELKMNNYKL